MKGADRMLVTGMLCVAMLAVVAGLPESLLAQQRFLVRYCRTIDGDSARTLFGRLSVTVVELAEQRHVALVQAGDSVGASLARMPWVKSITRLVAAVGQNLEERIVTRVIDVTADTCEPATASKRFNLNGAGVSIGVLDVGYPHHANTEGRLFIMGEGMMADGGVPGPGLCTPGSSCVHTTEVVGTLAGAGVNSGPCLTEHGMAPAARIYCGIATGFFTNRLADAIRYNHLTLANISMGMELDSVQPCGMLGGYEGLTADLDALIYDDSITVVVAGGNIRVEELLPDSCPLLGGRQYGMIMPFATSKNGISVGACGADHGSASFSAWGPTRGGRLKPDIIAPGIDVLTAVPSDDGKTVTYLYAQGTSIATPIVAGIAAIITQQLMLDSGMGAHRAPGPGLIKALLLNSAIDQDMPGPDYTTGYGMVDAAAAVAMVDSHCYLSGQVVNGDTVVYAFEVDDHTSEAAVMMVYNDLFGDPVDPVMSRSVDLPPEVLDPPLAVDLDLVAQGPDPGTPSRYPLTPDPQWPQLPAREAENHVDNVEQIVLRSPKPGEWTVRVIARSMARSLPRQRYSLTWRGMRLLGEHVLPRTVPSIEFRTKLIQGLD
ncbi:MAG TPA: S8 family serine peptidase [Candidatus Kapabacteria bacterium]|nr:S8 family serine peptidase [Candidatus Kapabacteria bacterium]